MIELVGLYVSKIENEKIRRMTAHVYLVKEDIDIRGIQIIVNGRRVFVNLPHLFAVDEGKLVRYPIICFCDADKTDKLRQFVADAATKFLKDDKTAKQIKNYNEAAIVRRLKKQHQDLVSKNQSERKRASNERRLDRKILEGR